MQWYHSNSHGRHSASGPMPFYAAPLGLWTPSSSISPEAMAIMAGLFMGLVVLLFFMHRRQKQKPPVDIFQGDSGSKVDIDAVLQEAADKRIRIDLVCLRQNVTHRHLQGNFTQAEKNSHLFLTLHSGESAGWQDAPVDVYFHFTEQRQKTFYHFSAFVQSIRQQGTTTIIVLPRPSMLTNNQRREFVRITPGAGMVEAATAWQHGPGIPLLAPKAMDMGRPHFAYRPPNIQMLELIDISASGLRLRLAVEQIRNLPCKLEVNGRFCVLLIMDAMRNDDAKIQLWLETVCRRMQVVPGNKHIDVGLQFTHWYLTTGIAAPIQWELVEADGEAPPLLPWISRVNVLLSRLTD